jgi:hypothetical protein
MEHILGKPEREIWVQTFDSPFTPFLMPCATSSKVDALVLPPFVPRTLRGRSHTPVFRGFNNFDDKLRSHGHLREQTCNRFYLFGALRGQSEGICKLLCCFSCLMPQRPIELLKFLLSYGLLQGFRNCNVCAGQSLRCNAPSGFLRNPVYRLSPRLSPIVDFFAVAPCIFNG